MAFGKSKARLLSDDQIKTTFDDVAGVDEAKEEVQELVEFLMDPGKFQRLGGRIPRGTLMVGAPGTGKTLLALQKACMLEEQGRKTLLVCYNSPLGKRFRNILSGCNLVTAGSFHSICNQLARRADIDFEEDDGSAAIINWS